jgi:intracellular sulfur oxidation DsrE/DsrF family protein
MGFLEDTMNETASITRRTAIGLAGGAALALGMASRLSAQEATPVPRTVPTPDPSLAFKVVLHVASQDGWPPAVSNLNHLTTVYTNAKVQLVVDGTGIYALTAENDITAKLKTFAAAGADLQVCGAALEEHNISPDAIPEYITIVAGGVVALVEAQVEGFAYVKP